MGVSIYSVKYNFFLFSLTIPFFQKIDFSEGKSGLTAVFCYRGCLERQKNRKLRG